MPVSYPPQTPNIAGLVYYATAGGPASSATGPQVSSVLTGRSDVFFTGFASGACAISGTPGGMDGSLFAYRFGRNDGGLSGLDLSNGTPIIRQYGTALCQFTGNGLSTTGTFESTTATQGIVLKSPDGTRYRVTIANGGNLAVAPA